MSLKDKTVLITASTRGIGLACVEAFAERGAAVYMAARDLARAEQTAERLNQNGGRVKCVYNDATKPETFRTMVEEAVNSSGRLDVLVNNFGVSDSKRDRELFNTETETFSEIVELNLRSVFAASRAAAEYMAAKGGGSIINISSVAGAIPDISQIAYGTSKAAINHLTRIIAVHGAKSNIRCNAILPGMTATESVSRHLSENFRQLFLRHIPLGRMGKPQEIAAAALFLADDSACYITGQTLMVSGGFGLATPLYADLSAAEQKR